MQHRTITSISAADSRTYTISELAREFGVTPRALRFYEDKDMLHPARDGMMRLYSNRDRARLTMALANEWAGRGVNVDAIAPGYMATDLTEALQNDPGRAPAILARIPAGRWGQPADLAGIAHTRTASGEDRSEPPSSPRPWSWRRGISAGGR